MGLAHVAKELAKCGWACEVLGAMMLVQHISLKGLAFCLKGSHVAWKPLGLWLDAEEKHRKKH